MDIGMYWKRQWFWCCHCLISSSTWLSEYHLEQQHKYSQLWLLLFFFVHRYGTLKAVWNESSCRTLILQSTLQCVLMLGLFGCLFITVNKVLVYSSNHWEKLRSACDSLNCTMYPILLAGATLYWLYWSFNYRKVIGTAQCQSPSASHNIKV